MNFDIVKLVSEMMGRGQAKKLMRDTDNLFLNYKNI